ncbi:MAG: bidirectional hydrogenase complex protein HoxU [Chloroflexi bacterium]|nr:bidirectional hydrogenase complex protein HoxU [Chloroflexota bacterium]
MTAPTRSHIKTLKIDGKDYSGHEEETILDIARQNDLFLPTLCQIDGLSVAGACRLCLVEVKTWNNRLVPACTTHVEEGIEVLTHSERIDNYRRMILELLFSEGNHVCAVCVSNGNCELQALAQKLGMDHVRFPNLRPVRVVDMTHDRFVLDRNRCVLCARCVRVCDEIEGAHTWDITGRGIDARIISDLDTPWGSSDTCTRCGKCVNIYPVGALVEKGSAIGEMVKHHDFLEYIAEMREARE